MRKGIVIGMALLLVIFAGLYFAPETALAPSKNGVEPHMRTYDSERYGVTFSYPDTYELSEHDGAGSALRARHSVVLINRADLPLPTDGEGSPMIAIDIYQNDLDSLTTESWIRGSAYSNFKLSVEGRLASTTLDGKEALSYRWSGLYEGTTVALARPAWIYALSVTYLQMGDQIIQDFVALRESARIR